MSWTGIFARRVHRPLYRSMAAELDAVRAGDKAIAMETWPRGGFDADHDRFVRLALARGLQVVHEAEGAAVCVYATPAEQAWRIPALHLLWRTHRETGWSDGAERLESHLLGYSEAAIDAWLAARRHARCGWRGVTVYLLLTRVQRAAIAATGDRCVVIDSAIPAACCDGTRVVAARPRIATGRVLARAAITEAVAAKLFRDRAAVRTIELRPAQAPAVNAALCSKLEVWTATGWR